MTLPTASSGPAAAGDATDIRVAVVDDSAVVRGLVTRWIDEEPELRTVGRYSNGKHAVDGIDASSPDVIVLDVEMPVMDGMTALPLLLSRDPNVKVIMASTLTRRNAEISLRALSLGAIDYIPKPETNRGVTTSSEFRKQLMRKIKAVGPKRHGARPVRKSSAPRAAETPVPCAQRRAAKPVVADTSAKPQFRRISPRPPRILVVGSSTGGPQALATLFGRIASAVGSVPVLVTQHMPATFTSILAEHLGRGTGLRAKEAEDGEQLRPGTIYVAPGGRHMAIKQSASGPVLDVYDGPDVNFCKPAVDPLFQSVARAYGASALAVVLTGMGHDGAAGAVEIADAGGTVLAQDEATSVVWGMPGATFAAGACAAVLPLEDIGPKIAALLGRAPS